MNRMINKKEMVYHDIRNLLFAVSGYMATKNYQKAEDKINEICNILKPPMSLKIIDEPFLNSFFNSKMMQINKQKIEFCFESKLCAKFTIDMCDLCTILGNIIDNAIEACAKIACPDGRWISLNLQNNYNNICITISNPIVTRVNESLKTTKKDVINHGIGIKSTKFIIEKYGGKLEIVENSQIFTLRIFLNNLNNKNAKITIF